MGDPLGTDDGKSVGNTEVLLVDSLCDGLFVEVDEGDDVGWLLGTAEEFCLPVGTGV